jgi:hypothetical protein
MLRTRVCPTEEILRIGPSVRRIRVRRAETPLMKKSASMPGRGSFSIGVHRSISPNTMSSEPMIADTSASRWP